MATSPTTATTRSQALVTLLLVALLLVGCGSAHSGAQSDARVTATASSPASESSTSPGSPRSPTISPSASPSASSASVSPTASVTASSTTAPPSSSPAVRQQKAFVQPVQYLTSPWFAGRQLVGINYGCTDAPFYVHDPRCPGN